MPGGLGMGMQRLLMWDKGGVPESIKWFTENQAFWLSYDLVPPPPHPPLSRHEVVSLSQSSCLSPVQLTDRRGVRRRGRSQIIWRRESLALYKSLNTLWGGLNFYTLQYSQKVSLRKTCDPINCEVPVQYDIQVNSLGAHSILSGVDWTFKQHSQKVSLHKTCHPLQWKVQIRHNLYFSMIHSGCPPCPVADIKAEKEEISLSTRFLPHFTREGQSDTSLSWTCIGPVFYVKCLFSGSIGHSDKGPP